LKTVVAIVAVLTFLTFSHGSKGQGDPSWTQVSEQKKGTITAYWYESKPFMYRDPRGKMAGIEFDLLEGFRKFLKQRRNIDLTINYTEGQSFRDTYTSIRDRHADVTLGVSAFSITDKREKEVDFTPAYMSDISVLITSDNIPILTSKAEFNLLLPKLTAITIEGTTYEQELIRLKTQGNLPFPIRYIPSSDNIMITISKTDSTFGFIDLPVYMMLFNDDPSIAVKRQNLFPIKRDGYAIIFPERSDWAIPLGEYFNNEKFQADLEKIISRYIDIELYHLMEGVAQSADNEEVMLLRKEKEIQYKDLLGKTDQIIKETRMRNFLVVLVSVSMVFLVIIISLYRKQNEQNEKIETQRKSIEQKSTLLEQRNNHLIALDEEKNNLIKILAHDLRTPINHIQGMAQIMLLENDSLPGDQKNLVQQITDSSIRINKMITHLLDIDALENNRVKALLDNVDIAGLLTKVVGSFDKTASHKNISLVCTSVAQPVYIHGDAIFLFEIFENLISNALKFSERGKMVSISLEAKETAVVIRVKDEGPGLTEEDRQLLFRKFQRLSARPTAGEGSIGLGLSIVKKYVEMMEGKVWCESTAGQGATFLVEFPVAGPPAEA
jgi:signal transduction histidine kinase